MGYIITVLVTGAGAPGIAGTIYALRTNPDGIGFRIITTDINDDVVGEYLADKFYRVPPPESEEYIPVVQEIVRKEEVKVIIPQTTRETIVLSKNMGRLADVGVRITVSSFESTKIANDKFLLLEKAKEIGVPCPTYYLTDSEGSLIEAVKSLGYPKKKVVIRPRVSSGMRGLRVLIEEAWDVQRFLGEKPEGVEITLNSLLDVLRHGRWPELLVTKYLPGSEYTIDAFRGKHGSVTIPRLRAKTRSGITFDAKIDLRPDLMGYSIKLAEALDLKYCFGFQFKVDKDGVPKLLEANPRVQGTMVASVFSGFNLIYYSVVEALEKPVKVSNLNLRDGLKFKRYWGGIAINQDGFIGKI